MLCDIEMDMATKDLPRGTNRSKMRLRFQQTAVLLPTKSMLARIARCHLPCCCLVIRSKLGTTQAQALTVPCKEKRPRYMITEFSWLMTNNPGQVVIAKREKRVKFSMQGCTGSLHQSVCVRLCMPRCTHVHALVTTRDTHVHEAVNSVRM